MTAAQFHALLICLAICAGAVCTILYGFLRLITTQLEQLTRLFFPVTDSSPEPEACGGPGAPFIDATDVKTKQFVYWTDAGEA